MAYAIRSLLSIIKTAVRTQVEFLAVVLLGSVAAVLIALPWLLRSFALLGWLCGTYLLWISVQDTYSTFTPAIPLAALAAVPALISVALPVWLFAQKRQSILWGAMILWGVIGILVRYILLPLLAEWPIGVIVIQILPSTLSATLLLYLTIRFGPAIRARRIRQLAAYGKR